MYKHLLLDPCNAPLTRSPYDLTQSTVVNRMVQLATNTQIFGIFVFHPVLGQYSYESATDVVGQLTPFGTFTGVSNRAIAGCHSVSFIAQESSRAGTISCGVVPGNVVWQYLAAANGGGGLTLKPSQAAAHITNLERTPVDRCEVNWFPAEGDASMTPNVTLIAANTNTIQTIFADTNFTMVVVLSASAGGAYQHKYVGVYEQTDTSVASTSPWTVAATTKPTFNWKSAVEELSAVDPAWYVNTFRKVGTFISGAVSSYATMGLPGALGYLTQSVAGMMRPRQNVKSN